MTNLYSSAEAYFIFVGILILCTMVALAVGKTHDNSSFA